MSRFSQPNIRPIFGVVGILALVIAMVGMFPANTMASEPAPVPQEDFEDIPSTAITSNSIRVTLKDMMSNTDGTKTWTYEVEELSKLHDLSDWVLEMPGCPIVSATPSGYTAVDPDPMSGLRGIQWDTSAISGTTPITGTPPISPTYVATAGTNSPSPAEFSDTGVFTVTVPQTATMGLVHVAAKAPSTAYGEVAGPVCSGGSADKEGDIGQLIIFEGTDFIINEGVILWILREDGTKIYLPDIKVDGTGKFKIKIKINVKCKIKIHAKGKKSGKLVFKEVDVTKITSDVIPIDTSLEPDYCVQGTHYIRYYNNEDLEGEPVNKGCGDSHLHFRWDKGIPAFGVDDDEFSAKWFVKVKFKKGRNKVRVLTDDGVRLSVNGMSIFNSWQLNPASIYERDFYIPIEGTYTVRVEYFEHHYVAAIQTLWCTPGDTCPAIYHPVPRDDDDDDDDDDNDSDSLASALADDIPIIPAGDIGSDNAPDIYIPEDTRTAPLDWNMTAGGDWTTDVRELSDDTEAVYLPVIFQ
jgi:hypothetical protein